MIRRAGMFQAILRLGMPGVRRENQWRPTMGVHLGRNEKYVGLSQRKCPKWHIRIQARGPHVISTAQIFYPKIPSIS